MTTSLSNRFLIALGSNAAEDLSANIQLIGEACVHIKSHNIVVAKTSRNWMTPPHPYGSGPTFVNACLEVEYGGEALDLLEIVHHIETSMGRVRTVRWGQRVIDIDLLAQDGVILPNPETVQHWIDLPPEEQVRIAPDQLILPHPRIQDRGFVLVPLAEIAPDWVHPLLGKTVSQMLSELPAEATAEIQPI